jgi:hypothetical protein
LTGSSTSRSDPGESQSSVDCPENTRAMRSFHSSIASWYWRAGSSAVQDLHTMTAAAQRPRRSAGPPHSGHSSCGSASVSLSGLMAHPPLATPSYPRPAQFEAASTRVHHRVAFRRIANLRLERSTNGERLKPKAGTRHGRLLMTSPRMPGAVPFLSQ